MPATGCCGAIGTDDVLGRTDALSAATTLTDRLKLARLIVSGGALKTFRRISFNPLMFWRLSGPVVDELLIAPHDLNTADPTLANEFYAGYFAFAGKAVNCSGASPFEVIPPSDAWFRELVEFGWLRHLRASETQISQVQARVHVDDWIRLQPNPSYPSWAIDMTAKRVISWLNHSPLLLEDCDHAFYRRFMKSLTRQVRYLRLSVNEAPAGIPRLTVVIALSYAAICMYGSESFAKNANRRLTRELEAQFLPDGGHIGRNPQTIIDSLLLLLPLRQAIISRNMVPDQVMISAIDRMMPMLRFFRLGDGNFAHFNGMSDTPGDLVSTILAYDDTAGTPVLNAPHSGYQRLSCGETAVIMDTGRVPPDTLSGHMHAGCLSFEMSSGNQRLIVNCGRPGIRSTDLDGQVWSKLARSTATHSTLSIENVSSCRFVENQHFGKIDGQPVLSGPQKVTLERTSEAGAVTLSASHDGYAGPFGLVHHREVNLTADGRILTGKDTVVTTRGKQIHRANKRTFQIRFHLHPQVSSSLSSPRTVELLLPSGDHWLFSCLNSNAKLDDSIALADIIGARQCKQIVIEGSLGDLSEINWILQRLS